MDSEGQTGQLETGAKVGPYEIQGTLGAGGMGTVYRARDPRLGRDVALKFLSGPYATEGEALERFHREARAISALNHPNVCTVYDIGEDRGRPFLVMELLEGQTLKQRIASGRIANDELIRIALQISNALEAAHSRGLVHRDIKPANIFLTSSGVTKILDFGLAKSVPVGRSNSATPRPAVDAAITSQETLTKAGVTLGTVSYLSPEQARGEDVDARSDLFAFGVVLYEMSTRVLPFTGDNWIVVLNAILERNPRPSRELNSELMRELETVIDKALEKDRRTRYQTASDLQSDLLRAQRKLESTRTSVAEVQPPGRFWPWALGFTALIVLVVLGAVVGARIFDPTNSGPTSPAEYVQITNFTDSAIWPSLSPDGSMITFLRGGGRFPTRGQVYVKLLPNGEAVQLTSGEATRFSPVFTPDGSRIAYSEVQSSPSVSWDTWTVSTLGGSPSRFLPNASGLTWVNPGSVLFSEIKSGLHMGIVVASEGRANAREIYFPDHERAMAHLSWASPDKKTTLISEMDRTATFQQCRLLPLDGSSSGRLVGPVGSCTSAGWSPDGRLMYFSVTVDGTSHLWRQRFPDGKPEQITFGPTEESGIAVAPDGKSLVSSVGLQHSTVWFHDDGGDRPINSEGFAYLPHLSGNGKRLYYLLRQNADPSSSGELRVVDLASNKTDNLLPGLLIADYDISRDERYVVYTTKQPGQELQMWYAPLDRRSPARVIAKGGDRPSFGANDEIIFQEFGEKTNYLSRVRIDGSRQERVIASPILNKMSVSPDGAWASIATAAPGQEGPQTVVIPLSGGGQLHKICAFSCAPQWSFDGKFFFVQTGLIGTTIGTTLAIPIPDGKGIPDLPATGTIADAPAPPNAQVIPNVVHSPGPNPSIYAFTKTEVQRNLFRIPLH